MRGAGRAITPTVMKIDLCNFVYNDFVMNLVGKHILLGVTGSIAAYKTASLIRLLVKAGAEVKVVMTIS